MYDAIVVGLGPAGSSAAYALASKGLKVLAFDKERFPRYKSCGGCISTKVRGLIDFDFAEVIEETVRGAAFTYKSERTMDILSGEPVGYNVMRDSFDAFLLNRAALAGARVMEGCRVSGFNDNGGSVEVTTASGQRHSALFLIGADGASGLVGRAFGLSPRQCAVSITSEVEYDSASFKRRFGGEKLFIDFGSVPYGYGWIFPKKNYLSVGMAGDAVKCGGRIKDYFNSFVSTHEALKGLKIKGRDGWTVPVYYNGASAAVKGRVLLAGDTGHLVDPFLGEGIYYAIRTGLSAASVVADCVAGGAADAAPYQAWLEREIYPEFRACEKMGELVYNHPRLWYSILEKEPEIMQRFYTVIRGTESAASFYGWVRNRIATKPWKVIRRWLDSRFLPL